MRKFVIILLLVVAVLVVIAMPKDKADTKKDWKAQLDALDFTMSQESKDANARGRDTGIKMAEEDFERRQGND